ncbi:methyl-accepting chemotaxis protein [Paenibacillus sp.]|uniref:methyl-accepting chemotaxis protein n=1 Tax=Paenibacillus sp. TaxID=58172 RepID=UPI0028128B0A|nr:methyl-accepting chemotaxis protein [Paenibacillus sp.]
MNKFRFKIGYKITIGFVVLLLFLAGALLTVSDAMQRLEEEIRVIVERDLRIQELTYRIDKNVSDMEAGHRGYAVTGEASFRSQYENAVESWEQNREQLASLLSSAPEQINRLTSAADAVVQWTAAAERQTAASAGRSIEALKAQYKDEAGNKQLEGLREQLSRLRQAEKYGMEQRVRALNERNLQLQKLMFGTLGGLTLLTIVFSWLVSRNVTRNLRTVMTMVADIASSGGDLTKRIQMKTSDEVQDLAQETNALLETLQRMIREVKEQSEELSGVSRTIESGAREAIGMNDQVNEAVRRVAAGAETQVAQIQEIGSAMTETIEGLGRISAHSQEVAEMARTTEEIAGSGIAGLVASQERIGNIEHSFEDIRRSVDDLSRHSAQIQTIVGYIGEISAQTNLLALNAAIEAARAGEHGRGFAVVSAEIRKLSQQAAASAGQIAEMLGRLNGGVERIVVVLADSEHVIFDGTASIRQASNSVKSAMSRFGTVTSLMIEVAGSIERIAEGSRQVAAASEEIGKVSEEMSAFAEEMSAMVEGQNDSLRQFSRMSEQLTQTSGKLTKVAGHFRV